MFKFLYTSYKLTMKNKLIVCGTSYDFVMGGVPTYFMRIFQWAASQGFDKALLIPKNREIYTIWKKQVDDLRLNIIRYDIPVKQLENVEIEKYDEVICIAADLHCYFRMFYYKNLNKYNNMKVFFYCLHPHATVVEKHKFFNLPYRKLIRDNLNNILFMDRETEKFCEEYYSLQVKNSKYYRVGSFFPNLDEERIKIRIKNRKNNFIILTIARFDFPFKGYILGLINTMGILGKEYPNLNLVIVGDGPNNDLVKEALNKLPLDIRKKISLTGEVAYNELQQYYDNASLYIGMGTTLIEASKSGLPSIVATAFQNGDSTVGFFDKEYDNVGGNIQLSAHDCMTFEECIRQELEKSDWQYREHCYKSYYTCKKYYQIDNIMEEILKKKQGKIESAAKYAFLNVYDCALMNLKIRVQNRRKQRR